MKTTYQANRDLGNSFGQRGNTIPAKYYIGLSTSNNVTEAGFTEPTTGGYARVELSNASGNFTVPASGSTSIAVDVSFAETNAYIGTIYAVGIFNASTGGNLLYYQALANPKLVDSETVLVFRTGSLTFTES